VLTEIPPETELSVAVGTQEGSCEMIATGPSRATDAVGDSMRSLRDATGIRSPLLHATARQHVSAMR
jgi:hypothetical protein